MRDAFPAEYEPIGPYLVAAANTPSLPAAAHLGSIFAKLAVTTRTAAAHEAVRLNVA
jgi:hypothetical protein